MQEFDFQKLLHSEEYGKMLEECTYQLRQENLSRPDLYTNDEIQYMVLSEVHHWTYNIWNDVLASYEPYGEEYEIVADYHNSGKKLLKQYNYVWYGYDYTEDKRWQTR